MVAKAEVDEVFYGTDQLLVERSYGDPNPSGESIEQAPQSSTSNSIYLNCFKRLYFLYGKNDALTPD